MALTRERGMLLLPVPDGEDAAGAMQLALEDAG